MVKIISNVKGDHVEASVELAGNMKAIVSELVNAIGSAYLQIGAQDKRAAQAFRKMFTQFVTSEDSPMWLEDSCDGVIVNASIVRAGKLTSEGCCQRNPLRRFQGRYQGFAGGDVT